MKYIFDELREIRKKAHLEFKNTNKLQNLKLNLNISKCYRPVSLIMLNQKN